MDYNNLILLLCCLGLGVKTKKEFIYLINKFAQEKSEYKEMSDNILNSIDEFCFLGDE